VCGYRKDLLDRAGAQLPRNWPELLELARRGLVVVRPIPVDSLMNFYMLCCALGEEPFLAAEQVVSQDTGIRALQMLRELVGLCDPECLRRNRLLLGPAGGE